MAIPTYLTRYHGPYVRVRDLGPNVFPPLSHFGWYHVMDDGNHVGYLPFPSPDLLLQMQEMNDAGVVVFVKRSYVVHEVVLDPHPDTNKGVRFRAVFDDTGRLLHYETEDHKMNVLAEAAKFVQ
jgi:hypothetical protein